jgi:Kef-type K+ transport system membrane component KefB
VSLLTGVFFLLVLSKFLGYGAERLRQPALVGEILAGVLLGPVCLGLIKPAPGLLALSELAAFFIVMTAGMEMDFGKVMKAFKGPALPISILGFFIPLASGIGVGILFHRDVLQTLFLGLCISITALPVTVWILKNLKLLKHRLADYSVAAAIVNDMAALLILGGVLDFSASRDANSVFLKIAFSIGKLALFVGAVFLAKVGLQGIGKGPWNPPGFIQRIGDSKGPQALFALVVLLVLGFGVLAEVLGLHALVGTFFGALLLDARLFGRHFAEVTRVLHPLSSGFFAPLFFALMGLEFSLGAFQSLPLLAAVILAAILSKISGGYLGGKWGGLPASEALGAGIIINGRGMMELVVAGIGLQKGLIGPDLFSILVLMGLVTTVLTPILFRRLVRLKN